MAIGGGKDITLNLRINAQEADKQIQNLKQRLESMRTSTDTRMVSAIQRYGSPDMQARYQQSIDQSRIKSMKELDVIGKSQITSWQKQDNLLKSLETRLGSLKKNTVEYNRTLEYTNTIKEKQAQIEQRIAATEDARSSIPGRDLPSYNLQGRSGEFAMAAMSRGKYGLAAKLGWKAMGGFAGAAGLLGDVGYGLSEAGNVAANFATYGNRVAGREATVAGGVGEFAKMQANRQGYQMPLYARERQIAIDRAMTSRAGFQAQDVLGVAGSALQIPAEIAKYAAGGAAVGSILPGVGTTVGGVVGGIYGGIKGISAFAQDDRLKDMLTGNYKNRLDAQTFETMQQQLEVEKAKSFETGLADQFFTQRGGQFRGLQRQYGLSDKDLFLGQGSALNRGAQQGFNIDTLMEQMGTIGASGGTKNAAVEGSVYAAQMARGLNLTNSGQLMGKISGGLNVGAEESRDKIIKMYSEATKIGLDSSAFAQETRQFLGTVADIVYKTGAGPEETARMLASGMGDLTQRGVQASAGALEELRSQTGGFGKPSSMFQMGDFMSKDFQDKYLGGKALTTNEMAILTNEDVATAQRGAELIAEKYGVDPKTLLEGVQKTKAKSTTLTGGEERAAEDYEEKINSGVYSQGAKNMAELGVYGYSATKGEKFGGVKDREAFFRMRSNTAFGGNFEGAGAGIGQIGDMMTGDTGRMADIKESSESKDDLGSLSNLASQSSRLADAFKANTEQSQAIAAAMKELKDTVGKNKEVFEEYTKILENITLQQKTGALAPNLGM